VRVRILGARQVDSAEGRSFAMLIDDRLAVDAGSLAGSLSLYEQLAVTDVLLTHHHLDHVKDLGPFGLNVFQRGQVTIHATNLVRSALREHLLHPNIWLDLFARPDPAQPVFIFHEIAPGEPFTVGPYQVNPVAMRHHAVPVTGYEVWREGSGRVFYTGDTGPGCQDVWSRVRPDLLVIETTFASSLDAVARQSGHLTPTTLRAELTAFRDLHDYLPRVVAVHVNTYHLEDVRREIAEVAADLGADISVAEGGQIFEI
jgi:ribonuclease BN (tRNA processing enzyme)